MAKPFLILQLRPEDVTADDELAAIKRYGGLDEKAVVRRRAERQGLNDSSGMKPSSRVKYSSGVNHSSGMKPSSGVKYSSPLELQFTPR